MRIEKRGEIMDNENMNEEKSTFVKMAEDLAKIRDAMAKLEGMGISRQLMVLYIQDKTKLGKQKINTVLDAQKEFLDKAIEE